MKPKTARKGWLITAAAGAAAVAYVMMILLPGLKKLERDRQAIQEKKAYILQAAELSSAFQAAQQELNDTRKFNSSAAQRLPKSTGVAKVFEQITQAAQDTEIATARFDPDPPQKQVCLSAIPLQLNLHGPTQKIFEFLKRVEGLPTRMWIETLRMAAGPKNVEDTLAEVSLVIFSENSEDLDYVNRVK